MDPVQAALYGVAIPAAAAAAVLLAVRALTKARAAETGVGPAIAAGLVAAFLGLAGAPAIPPNERWHWLPIAALVSAIVGVAEARLPEIARSALRVGIVLLAVFATTPAANRATFGTFAILLAATLSARGMDALSRFGGPGAALAPFAVTTLAAAISLALFSGWATLGLLCGALTSAIAACLLLGLKFPAHARDASLPAATLLAVIAACGANFTDPQMPPAAAVLLAVAPCGGALAVGLLARRGATLRLVLRAAGGAAIPAGIATAIAAHASP